MKIKTKQKIRKTKKCQNKANCTAKQSYSNKNTMGLALKGVMINGMELKTQI